MSDLNTEAPSEKQSFEGGRQRRLQSNASAPARHREGCARSPRRMRDSGVEWLGVVPEEWRIGYLFQQVRQVKCLNEGLVEKNLLSLSYGKIKRRNIDAVGGLLPASFEGYNRIEPGDIVLRLTDLQNDQHSLRTGLSHEKGIVTSAYLTVRPADGSNSAYLHYALYGFDVVKGFYGMGAGVRQGITYGDVKLLKLPVPPLPEQRAIAAYLDERCARIDAMVADAKKLIEEYKAWKSSLIFEAVTGKRDVKSEALRVKSELRDSGVEWIGVVPEGWRVSRFKYILRNSLQYGASESGIPFDKALPRYIRITDITLDGKLKDDGRLSLTEETASEYILNDLDILLARSGATVGKAFLYRSRFGRSAFAGYLIRAIIDPLKADPLFAHYTMQGVGYENWKSSIAVSATIQNIGADKYNEYQLPLPSLPEQRAIAAYLDWKCAAIDRVVAEKEGLIADLEQYKKSLIFECVTGKREVA